MADETGPTERTGTHEIRRVLTADERDELLALARAVGRTEFREGMATVDGTSTREQRRARTAESHEAYAAFVDHLIAMTKLPTAAELRAEDEARRGDGPRAKAPVEVVAECGEVTS